MVPPRALVLKPRGRKAPDLGPEVPVKTVRLSPAADSKGLEAIIGTEGFFTPGKLESRLHRSDAKTMWAGNCGGDTAIEFELADPAALTSVEVWNYNEELHTGWGLRAAEVAVSADGTAWKTVLPNAEFTQAEGRSVYDAPSIVKLDGAVVRKVRLQHLVPWEGTGKVGLSKVVFHQAGGARVEAQPQSGTAAVAR